MWAVNVLLVAGLAYSASVVTAAWLERELVANTSRPAQTRKTGVSREQKRSATPLSGFQAILDTNMFRAKRSGPPPAPAAAAAPTAVANAAEPVEPSKELPIRLSLTGTFITDAGAIAFVVGPDGRTERTYRVKECLPRPDDTPVFTCQPTQGKLERINSEKIVVTMNGARYDVRLGEAGTSKPAPRANVRKTSRGKISRGGGVKRGPTARRTAKKKGAYPTTQEGNNIEMTVPNAEVEKAFENFAGILNQARVVPYMVDGTPQGFQIRKIQPGSIFEKLGLSNSDIIKSVNGESLTTADQALRLFSLFRNEREVALEIERNNQPINLTYTIE